MSSSQYLLIWRNYVCFMLRYEVTEADLKDSECIFIQ